MKGNIIAKITTSTTTAKTCVKKIIAMKQIIVTVIISLGLAVISSNLSILEAATPVVTSTPTTGDSATSTSPVWLAIGFVFFLFVTALPNQSYIKEVTYTSKYLTVKTAVAIATVKTYVKKVIATRPAAHSSVIWVLLSFSLSLNILGSTIPIANTVATPEDIVTNNSSVGIIFKNFFLPVIVAIVAYKVKHRDDIIAKRKKLKATRILLLEVLDADLHYLRASLSNPLLILYFKNNPLMSKNDIISIVFEMSPEEMEIIAKHYNNIFTLSALLQESNIDAVAFCNYNKEIIKHDIDTVNKSINVVRSFIK